MRLRAIVIVAAMAAAPDWAIAQGAQQTAAPASDGPAPAEVEFGVRVSGGVDDVGRFQSYRDPRSGPTLNVLRYDTDRETWAFTSRFENVGYRDQRYRLTFDRYGTFKASFDWNQVPTWYSGVAQSPFREELPGVFRLDDATQRAVQNRTATLQAYGAQLEAFDIRARRDVADARVTYSPALNTDVRVNYLGQRRSGQQPWGASFGFNDASEVALSLDQRSHLLTTEVEWSTPRASARLGYDGSWFDNGVEALIWDNPLRFTDQTTSNAYSTGEGSSQGRMALFPDSSAHTVSASGSLALPAKSRAFGYVSIGRWLQDEQLLPHTINTAITPIPLARQSADGEARVTAMTYRITSRPAPMLWLNAQYRLYDFDNRTPHFPLTEYVRLDGTVGTSATGGSEPFEYTRHFFDVDASVTPLRHLALRAGYGRERDERAYRYFEETTEDIVRASVDATGFAWGSARLQYDRSQRRGDGFDEEVLDDIGEQVSLRQFDISDRDRDRVSAIVQVMPWETVGFNVTVSAGQDTRPDTEFGMQEGDMRSVTIGADLTPRDALAFGVSYAFENYSTLQRSRQANPGPQFDDPTRDWQTDMDEDVHTWSFSLNARLTRRTSVDALYDFVDGTAQYLYVLPPNSTLPPPSQLPPLTNQFHRVSADVRHALNSRLAIAFGYRLDKWSVDEFGRSPEILNTPLITAFVNTLYQWRPYDLHSGSLRLIYRW